MKIKNILISQPNPGNNSPYAELKEKYNLTIDFIPFIRVEGLSAKEFRLQKINILDHTALIFTSRAAIDTFFGLCKTMRITIPETMKYFCITEAIALYLQKYTTYRKRKIFFGKGNVPSLIEAIGTKHSGEHFLLTLSDNHKPELPKAFDKAKLKYTKAILNHTVLCDLSSIDLQNYDMLVFYSPSDVKSLLQNFPEFEQGDMLFATFGPATAKALKAAKLKACVEAPTPEAPSIIQALTQYLKQ